MPLYEFKCTGCGLEFEKICSVNIKEGEINCPECRKKSQKKLSLFNFKSSGKSSHSSCSACSSNSCSTCSH